MNLIVFVIFEIAKKSLNKVKNILSFLLTIDIDLNDVMRSTRKSRGDINAGK